MKQIFILFFLISTTIFAQTFTELGITYGESELLRSNAESYYNYTNQEFGIFVGKNYGWKSNSEEKTVQKFWLLQSNMHYGKYEFLELKNKENIFKVNLLGGIKISKTLSEFNLILKGMIGGGYNTGYPYRMAEGIYFTEQVVVGIELPKKDKISPFFNLGFKHVSNANLYDLNRGTDVVFAQIGIRFPSSQ